MPVSRIVVADDNAASRELIRAILKGRSYEVVEACDGGQAIQKIEETNPDLVLLDIYMPVLDGYCVVKKLRRDPRFASLPIAAVTAFPGEMHQEKALAAGFDAYITKPIRAATLRSKVEHLLGRRAM